MTSHDGRIGVGIIGAGEIAGAHMRGYTQAAEHARVTAIADVDPLRAQRFAESAGGTEVFADYKQMIESPLVDAVDICLPHHLHRDAIVAAAAAGKHILCEKPLCVTLDEAEAVKHAVASAGITLMCAHNQLFLPTVATARQMIRDGKLGKVYAARTTDIFRLTIEPERLGWRARRATSGGGELIDTGYHPTYLLLNLIDSAPVKVVAFVSRHRIAMLEGEDTANVLVEFADGTVGTIVTSWAYEPPSCTERFSVAGESGSLWSDGRALYYKPAGGEQVTVQAAGAETDTYALEVVDFIDCLREARRPLNTEVEGIKVLEVILGAYESAERGEITELKNP
ncbi:MAG TPA: Gfo/Idh/MocA family oxidoreductase [Candidatus Dormibacteraeota bacterium]|nr:Gfo/Idh/MocA family oxidoreductase [Candidatus Dormibacteraeota bacterium]